MFEDMVKAVKKNREIKNERVANFDFAYPYILSRAGPGHDTHSRYRGVDHAFFVILCIDNTLSGATIRSLQMLYVFLQVCYINSLLDALFILIRLDHFRQG